MRTGELVRPCVARWAPSELANTTNPGPMNADQLAQHVGKQIVGDMGNVAKKGLTIIEIVLIGAAVLFVADEVLDAARGSISYRSPRFSLVRRMNIPTPKKRNSIARFALLFDGLRSE